MDIRVDVCSVDQYDRFGPGGNALNFAEWVTGKIDSIPVEHRGRACVHISSSSDAASEPSGFIEIYYLRPETGGESAHRRRYGNTSGLTRRVK